MPSSPSHRFFSPKEAHEIPELARAYAQNRSLAVAVALIVFVMLSGLIAGSSYAAGEAYRSGHSLLFGLAVGLLASAMIALIYFSVPRWGGRLLNGMSQRLYAADGSVAVHASSRASSSWGVILGGVFGACVLASVALGFLFDLPAKYMQPISACYVVPFLVGLWFVMRPMVGYAALLWPGLYAIHAIAILAGAPIVFSGVWEFLNVLLPIAGYGILSAVVAHLYGRIALSRLRTLAQTTPTDFEPREDAKSE